MTQSNANKGSEFLVPDYRLNDLGGFVYGKKSWPKWTLNTGIRYDMRWLEGKPLYLDSLGIPVSSGDTVFAGFNTIFSAFSGSTGFTFAASRASNLK